MKILVTGGNGFLGSWIVRALVQDHEIRVLHRPNSDMSALEGLRYESVLGDVTDYESVRRATQGMDAVFHAAAVINYSPTGYALMEKVNVGGTANVTRAAVEAGVKKLVHTSSVVAVGATPAPKLLNEDSPYELGIYHFGYYETKRQAERVVLDAVKDHGLDAVIVNPSTMFGAGDAVKGSRKTHNRVAAGRFPFYSAGGMNVMHVADAVEGHILAMKKGRSGQRYILGGENLLVKQLFEMLARAAGRRPPPIAIPNAFLRTAYDLSRRVHRWGVKISAPSDQAFLGTMFHWYDTKKAKEELGFKARPAIQAVEESVQWSLDHGILKHP